MDTTTAITKLEAAVEQQLLLAGGDDAVSMAGEVILGALAPALRELALDLCQQAAAEVSGQLPDRDVEIVLRDGHPTLVVRDATGRAEPTLEDLEARLTLRLPENLKKLVEEEASAAGDSINSWVVRTLSSRARTRQPSSGATSGEFLT